MQWNYPDETEARLTEAFGAARRELQQEGVLGKTPEGQDCVTIPTSDALRIAANPFTNPWKALHIACLLTDGWCLQPLNAEQRLITNSIAHRLCAWIDGFDEQPSEGAAFPQVLPPHSRN